MISVMSNGELLGVFELFHKRKAKKIIIIVERVTNYVVRPSSEPASLAMEGDIFDKKIQDDNLEEELEGHKEEIIGDRDHWRFEFPELWADMGRYEELLNGRMEEANSGRNDRTEIDHNTLKPGANDENGQGLEVEQESNETENKGLETVGQGRIDAGIGSNVTENEGLEIARHGRIDTSIGTNGATANEDLEIGQGVNNEGLGTSERVSIDDDLIRKVMEGYESNDDEGLVNQFEETDADIAKRVMQGIPFEV